MEKVLLNQEEIIQIKLFENEVLTTTKFIRFSGISLGIALLVSIATYYFLNIQHPLIHLSLLTITLSIIIAKSLLNDLFPKSDMILIIAFGEFQLMKNNQILYCEKIENLGFELENSLLVIKGLYTSNMLIGLAASHQESSISSKKIDYVIYSKSDWQILLSICP